MIFDDDGAYPADHYEYYGRSHRHEFRRITVAAEADPSVSRTFLTCQEAPSRWLVEAFLLATGQARRAGGESLGNLYDGPIPFPVSAPAFAAEGPTPVGGYLFDTIGSDRIEPGEPQIQILDEDADVTADRRWQSATAPLRREHVQQELTRRFGVVRPEFDTSGRDELSSEIGSHALESLLMDLPPARRLALRAHLVDAGLVGPVRLDPEIAARLLMPMQWLIDRVGSEGVEQDEHGGVPSRLADEAKAAMNWTAAPHSPPSPGRALIDLALASRFIRRYRGRIVPTARARSMAEKPVRALAELQNPAAPLRNSWYESPMNHSGTLARLAIADGSATKASEVVAQVVSGLQTLRPGTKRRFGIDHAPESDEQETMATRAVAELMAEIAPLAGPGWYGALTPPMRAYVRARLLPERSRYGW